LDRAAILAAQSLPAEAPLFATVDDALALQYITKIWGIRQDLRVVGSDVAGELIRAGRSVMSTWDAAPLLKQELPDDLPIHMEMVSPDWVHVFAGEGPTSPPGDIPTGWTVDSGLALHSFTLRAAPDGAPVLDHNPFVDLTLVWQLDDGTWPEGLSISVRPKTGSSYLDEPSGPPGTIVQEDRGLPAYGLTLPQDRDGPILVSDAYRVYSPPGVDGVGILLYRKENGRFETVAELHVPLLPVEK
jgi:hypothetical protein